MDWDYTHIRLQKKKTILLTFRVPGNGCVVVWLNSAFVHTCRSKGRPLWGFAWCPSFGHSLNFLCRTLKASLTAAGKVDFLSALKIYHHGSALAFKYIFAPPFNISMRHVSVLLLDTEWGGVCVVWRTVAVSQSWPLCFPFLCFQFLSFFSSLCMCVFFVFQTSVKLVL